MTNCKIYNLCHRGLLRLHGKEVLQFLQGIITNDIRRLIDGQAQYALMLNHRGRIVEDLILYKQSNEILIESDRNNQSKLQKLLEMYKMHKDVFIDPLDNYSIYHTDSTVNLPGIIDPRVPSFGKRILSIMAPDGKIADKNAYDEKRFDFGIAEGPNELAGELPVFINADIMNGLSADKGCYLGQEMTARALNAPEVRKRLLPFKCTGMVDGIITDDGRREGKIIACNGSKGLAVISYAVKTEKFQAHYKLGDNEIEFFLPSWWPADQILLSSQSEIL